MVWEQREAVFPAKFGTPDRPLRTCYIIPAISHDVF